MTESDGHVLSYALLAMLENLAVSRKVATFKKSLIKQA